MKKKCKPQSLMIGNDTTTANSVVICKGLYRNCLLHRIRGANRIQTGQRVQDHVLLRQCIDDHTVTVFLHPAS